MVIEAGEKLRPWPAPCGISMVAPAAVVVVTPETVEADVATDVLEVEVWLLVEAAGITTIVPCIQAEWNRQSYVYVPGIVSVTLNTAPPVITKGEFAGPGLAAAGTDSQKTLWGALLSWSTNVTVVPAETASESGEKFNEVSTPTFCGMITMADAFDPEADVELVLRDDAVPVVALALSTVMEPRIQPEWKAQWYVYVPGTVSATLNVSP
jgi:hypothetical protein